MTPAPPSVPYLGPECSLTPSLPSLPPLINCLRRCGFWIFSFFCGAGLTALPFDMIMVFVFRPVKLDAQVGG